ncbi:MAG: VOC family protein [Selenomonadaceae bacterium]|nr:VOC family protein [Selenomonadaceae bacterium]
MKIEHIAAYVKDLEGAKNFFEKYFGAKSNELYHNTEKNFKSYFLSFGNGARLEIMNKPELEASRSLNRVGLIHLAFSVGSKEKVVELTEKLKSDGFKIMSEPRTTGDGYFESCVLGFENIQIEITI